MFSCVLINALQGLLFFVEILIADGAFVRSGSLRYLYAILNEV
jgi:hypothetical protein